MRTFEFTMLGETVKIGINDSGTHVIVKFGGKLVEDSRYNAFQWPEVPGFRDSELNTAMRERAEQSIHLFLMNALRRVNL